MKVNAAQRDGDSKYGTGSIRKQTEAKVLAIAARKRAEATAKEASLKLSDELTSKLESKGTLGMFSAVGLTPKKLGFDSIFTRLVTGDNDKKPLTHRTDASPPPKSNVGSILARKQLGEKLRNNLVQNLLGNSTPSQ